MHEYYTLYIVLLTSKHLSDDGANAIFIRNLSTLQSKLLDGYADWVDGVKWPTQCPIIGVGRTCDSSGLGPQQKKRNVFILPRSTQQNVSLFLNFKTIFFQKRLSPMIYMNINMNSFRLGSYVNFNEQLHYLCLLTTPFA